MQLRPDIQLQTVIKAMMDDVIPALDQTNQLAMQSAQLTVGTLSLMAQQLPLAYRYDCDELARLINAGKLLRIQIKGDHKAASALAELEETIGTSMAVLERAKAEPAELLASIRSLRSVTGDTVRTIYEEASETTIASVEETILTNAKEQLLRDRSWLLTQGWEPDPESVPAIETLLSQQQDLAE